MTEWIDFALYVASALVVWIMLPLAYRELAVPVLMDRNPEWVAANPAAVQRIARSYWFNNSCIAWGVVTVTVLLLVQLGVPVPGTNETQPLWQRLNSLSNLLFGIGFIGFAAAMYFCRRQLNRWIPPGVRRSASLRPRSAADFVPRTWRMATELLTAGLFVVWITLGLLGIASSPRLWTGFAFLLGLSILFAVLARLCAHRPPNYMDRLYGPAYRHREVRVIYGVRLAFVAFGAIALTGSVIGTDAMPLHPARLSSLLFQIIFVGSLLAFLLIKPAGSGAAPPFPQGLKASGVLTSLVLLVVVPLIVVASISTTPARSSAASRPSFRGLQDAGSADPQWVGRWLR